RVASLFLWHFVEEVEHRSSAMVIYRSVVGDERYRLRKVPAIFSHVLGVYKGAVRSFDEVVPEADRVIEAKRLLPGRTWLREVGVRIPGLRQRVKADGYGSPFEPASPRELLA